MGKRLTLEHFHALAESRAFKWVGEYLPYALDKTQWECKNGHTWMAAYHDIRAGNGCPHCSGQSPVTAGDYARAAEERGFFWVGTLPKATHQKTRWQCSKGHVWEQTYRNIAHNKSGCPRCKYEAHAHYRKLKPGAYHTLAEKRGFKWVGTEVSNSQIKTLWECPNGHQWESDYNNISNGSGCPECADMVNSQRVSKPQRMIAEMTGGLLNYPVNRYRLDVALPDQKIDIEYDGWFWHNASRDTARDAILISEGWRIIRIKSGVMLPTIEQITAAIADLLTGKHITEIVLDDWVAI